DRFANAAIELEYGAGPQFQEFADIHLGTAEHRRDLYRHVEHSLEVGGDARGILLIVIGNVTRRRWLGGVEVGKRNLCVGVTHGSFLVWFALAAGSGLVARRHIAPDKVVDLCSDGRAL